MGVRATHRVTGEQIEKRGHQDVADEIERRGGDPADWGPEDSWELTVVPADPRFQDMTNPWGVEAQRMERLRRNRRDGIKS